MCVQSCPWMKSCPAAMGSSPTMPLSKVLLPAPLAPMIATVCPRGMVSAKSRSTDWRRLPPDAITTAAQLARRSHTVTPKLSCQAVVDMLQVQSARLQTLTEELAQVRASLDERKLIERCASLR